MKFLLKKDQNTSVGGALLSFLKSWDTHNTDEMSVGSGALDTLHVALNGRPCCVWKKVNHQLSKLCERGMLESNPDREKNDRQRILTRVLDTGQSFFETSSSGIISNDVSSEYDGFFHVPIKFSKTVLGVLSVGVFQRELSDENFIQALESYGHVVGVAFQQTQILEETEARERRLRAEVGATTRELEQTNKKLIERVKELKMLYGELQKRVQELTKANRAKDEFLSIVSHELRTPLTALTGFLAVLLEEEAGPVNEQQRKFLTITKQSASRLNLLISDLLDVSRIEAGRLNMNMGECSLTDILQRSIEGLKNTAKNKGVDLRLDVFPNLPLVWGDADRLQQVIDNLLSNAIKFTEAGGAITVFSAEKDQFIQVCVRDSGRGLTPEERAKVFDMFYQADASTRRSAGGAGLGLAIARGIVAMHGGTMSVESDKGKGSNFFFLIPRLRAQKAA